MSGARTEVRRRMSLDVGGVRGQGRVELFARPSDCADIFGLVVPAELGFLRDVGTTIRSAQCTFS